MAKKEIDFDELESAGENAAMVETATNEIELHTKTIKTIPMSYVKQHKALKAQGKTGLNLTAYMLEAFREKLSNDK